ncbi:MAG: hypothetical protein K2L72_02835, partial [Clostridia bacterium]|nr:hypothetical protein [Clostridia bacterium]
FSSFNKYTNEWQIPALSFMQIDHDNDDLVAISEEAAKEISKGASFEEDYKKFLSIIGSVRKS